MKPKSQTKLKNPVIKTLMTQLFIFFGFILMDIYTFRGYYSSMVKIQTGLYDSKQKSTSVLRIRKTDDNIYHFHFKNNSILPIYLINYRNDHYIQNITDSSFFNYFHPTLPQIQNYQNRFDCGTGLGLTSINPLETFEIVKTYNEIIEEARFMLSNQIDNKTDLPQYDLIPNPQNLETTTVTADSISIEYYIVLYSFVSKTEMQIISNQINISLTDLMEKDK